MAVNGYLAHNLIDGTSVPQNMANFGYDGSTHGENIAAGMDTAAEAMQVWQNSGGSLNLDAAVGLPILEASWAGVAAA